MNWLLYFRNHLASWILRKFESSPEEFVRITSGIRCIYLQILLSRVYWFFPDFNLCGNRTLNSDLKPCFHRLWCCPRVASVVKRTVNNWNLIICDPLSTPFNQQEFVLNLSILSRGTLDEKLEWTFQLYDVNGDGFISKEEMTEVMTSVYELMGKVSEGCKEENQIKAKVENMFKVTSCLLSFTIICFLPPRMKQLSDCFFLLHQKSRSRKWIWMQMIKSRSKSFSRLATKTTD